MALMSGVKAYAIFLVEKYASAHLIAESTPVRRPAMLETVRNVLVPKKSSVGVAKRRRLLHAEKARTWNVS